MPSGKAASGDGGNGAPGGEPNDIEEHLVRLRRLANHAWEHFKEDRCFEEAASLSYTSLLALVPLLAVIFGVVSAFPVFAEWSSQLQSFIVTNLMPAAGEQFEQHLAKFLNSISELTLPGTITLIVTALLLMFRIEIAFNRVWRVGRPRSLGNRIIVYWAVLTLAPLLIGAALVMSAQHLFGGIVAQVTVYPFLYQIGIFGITWIVFALIFVLVPNRRVRFRDALGGALLGALLFEIAKFGFVAYVTNANYAVIYGALATIPIFLFWLYLVWVVVLLGASLAASLTTFHDRPRADGDWPPGAELQMAFRLVGHLWRAQRKGAKCEHEKLLDLEPRLGERQMLQILQALEDVDIVTLDDEGDWMLSRDPGDLTLALVYRCGRFHLPHPDRDPVPVENAWDRVFAKVLKEVQDEGFGPLDRPIRQLYIEAEEESES